MNTIYQQIQSYIMNKYIIDINVIELIEQYTKYGKEIIINSSNKSLVLTEKNRFVIIPKHNVKLNDKIHNNLLITSLNNRWLIQDMKNIKLSFYNKRINISNKFIGSTYYIICGGGLEIYNAVYTGPDQSLYPIDDIPFSQVIHSNIEIYFDILENISCDLSTIHLRFYVNSFISKNNTIKCHITNGRKYIDIPWINKNTLRICDGVCALLLNVEQDKITDSLKGTTNLIQHDTLKILHFNNYSVCLSSDIGIFALIRDYPDAVFEKLSFIFVTNNNKYKTDIFSIYTAHADAVSNFKIISSNKLLVFPVIIYNKMQITCDQEIINDDEYIYSSNSFDDYKIINNMIFFDESIKNIRKLLQITNISSGKYIFQFDRIFINYRKRDSLSKKHNLPIQLFKLSEL
jgi:hypothetical protein